ncbi:alpha/beta fold hydrolase [Ruegeria meonggei]|uniref:Haloalkane dehalogenase n=1 Tax=Ruegeria meonggei TaxID=1446476 RepID=A0A1X6YJQ2_9RHOB|nr:alpha/beta hydrolase [Ruegeria meonggei]SLN22876.1 haloalkane dehalogenase [Ruegeria meonggei]
MSVAQNLHVSHLGQGDRKVLALHCTIAHSGVWAGLAAVLKGQASFVAPDMLSHGRSPDWDRQGHLFERLTEASLEHLTEPMDVIGHSFGAMIALRLAVEHPELVRSVVLVEPVFFAVAQQDAPDLVAEYAHVAQPYMDAIAAGDEPLAARLFNRMWAGDAGPQWADLPEPARAGMVRGIHLVGAVENALLNDTMGLLDPSKIAQADMPVLLLHGSHTHKVMVAINSGLQTRLPQAESDVIDGAGHMGPISHPRETGAAIAAFWDGLPS